MERARRVMSKSCLRPSPSPAVLKVWQGGEPNEHLISAVRGHSLTAVRSRSDLEHREGTWTQAAFASAFTFDFDDEGRYLAEHLTRVGA
jgi:hypothetical protein